jgi:hypothetical protein
MKAMKKCLEREKLELVIIIFPRPACKHVFWPVRKKESISCWKNPCPFLRLLPPDERAPAKKTEFFCRWAMCSAIFPRTGPPAALIESGKLGALAMISDLRTNNYFQPGRPRWFLEKAMAGGRHLHKLWRPFPGLRFVIYRKAISHGPRKLHLFAARHRCGRLARRCCCAPAAVSALPFSLCGYSVVPIDETMLFFANGSLRLHTGSDLSVTCGIGYETVLIQTVYPNAFEAQWQTSFPACAPDVSCIATHLRSVHRCAPSSYSITKRGSSV